ncbi:16S rRNA pseudouridine(516) synthase [Clostridium estertheticum]|uniref:Pseudouridine synthase n=1 Tax=Clostridium estertheticum subsp. estertheticum TaxID=1552 RepID=A0A1J0GC83_9CLOT|nr:16S rRNA pseudouridine(516) synthase [Clostridium estertheticum]APC38875.1 16S rRNA pseudouridine(516) synthase [Clostridium estertheticum subsp. estertheticum]MBU3186699.1 pseudouridine synthase [Clostridium estertheticum]MBW9173826.1 pseudouridine synthase [Clostridium estertheticum]MBZ9615181.1 pseudouridine synthase [Clostridium estertheticum subsp. laramiense]MCB2354735.1 pseudouridine synthase [Clostridium estertheticum]
MDRIDKILSNLGHGTRKEVKALLKKKKVEVDGVIATDSAMKVDPEKAVIKVSGDEINYRKYIYLVMNKPSGVVSATVDRNDETVIDLIDEQYRAFKPFPIGRLDKDTVGLLLITNDGELNHKLIAPKNHVDKVYYAEINKFIDASDINTFKKGVVIDDGYKCMPAELEVLTANENGSEVMVTIQEGKFHQVKRMFESVNKNVMFLRRVSFGPLKLDEDLVEGQCRELSEDEINLLKQV